MSTFRPPVPIGGLTVVSFFIKRNYGTASFNVLGHIDLGSQRVQIPR